MFLQLVTPSSGSPPVQACADSLFIYTPLQLSAIAETVWRNRYNAGVSSTAPIAPFVPWPQGLTDAILTPTPISGYYFGGHNPQQIVQGIGVMPSGESFVQPLALPGLQTAGSNPKPTNWDHLIYAYLVENTRIFDIFAKVLETYMFGERLETPSPASQQFWRNTEYLLFGDGIPSMLWTTASRLRRDEIANRLTVYYWMFGVDLAHAPELAASHPYEKPAAANRDFIPTFEAFGGEVWQGIQNAKNLSGANPTDPAVIATLARRLFDMAATRRLNGNLAREEFRAVALMSWLHLAVLYDSPVVQDLKATASSPEQRLAKIAERVGMTAHAKSKPLFDLAQPFSALMQAIETGSYSNTTGAALLYQLGTVTEQNAETVVDQYTLATGRDLKARAVAITGRGATAPPPRLAPPAAPRAAPRGNGHLRPGAP